MKTPDAQIPPMPPPSEEPPAKPKKKTVKEVTAELEDLQEVAAKRTKMIRDLRIQEQKAITLLRETSSPGITLQQEHYNLTYLVTQLRELFGVKVDG